MRKALLLLCLLSGQAWGATYYAAPGGGAATSCIDATTNVCTVARCIAVAGNTDTCSIAAGIYPGSELGGSGYVIETGEFVNLVCAGTVGTCIFQPTGTNVSGIRLNSPVAGGTFTATGIKIDGSSATPLDQCFYYADSTALYSVVSTDNTCTEADIYDHRIVANEMNLTSTRDTMTTSTAVSPRSFVATIGMWAEGGVSVDYAIVNIANRRRRNWFSHKLDSQRSQRPRHDYRLYRRNSISEYPERGRDREYDHGDGRERRHDRIGLRRRFVSSSAWYPLVLKWGIR